MKTIILCVVLYATLSSSAILGALIRPPPAEPTSPTESFISQNEAVDDSKQCQEEPYYAEIASTITQEEIDLLGSVIRAEAGNQSFIGQKAVAEVVLNRVMSPKFPNTIKEVVYQKSQFSTAPVLDQYPPTEFQYEVIDSVLQERTPILPADVMFFATYPFREVYEQIGDHYFCY